MTDIDRERAESIAASAFEAHGISTADARRTADVLVRADAMEKHSHGLLRLPRFVRGIEHGNVDPDGEIRVLREGGATATLSGGSRLGPVVATEATAEATTRAEEFGVGVVGVQNSNHLGMLGHYTDLAQEEGYIGLAVTNTEPAMAPHGGTEAVLGTNPIAVGLPTDPPFNLDMSTAAIARGTVLHERERGGEVPEGVALDADGNPTTDPEAALEGVLRPFGGAKGSGLAIAVEMLAGGLVGAAMGVDVTGTYHTGAPCTKGDLFVVLDPEALGGPGAVASMSDFLAALTAEEAAPGHDRIRLPGEDSLRRANADRITVEDDVWATVRDLADG